MVPMEPVEICGKYPAALTMEAIDGEVASTGVTNHGLAVVSALKKSRSACATFRSPNADGCVPSCWNSSHAQVSPSNRRLSPSAQRYGPHATHGTFPAAIAMPAALLI